MLDVLAAFFTAALSGMGVGGGGLLLLYLTLFRDVAQWEAQLTNLCFFLAASTASLVIHVMRRKISPSVVILLATGGVAGAFLGSFIAKNTDESMLRIILGVFLAASGVLSLFGKKPPKTKKDSFSKM